MPNQIGIRQATHEDCEKIYEWRNHEKIRKWSFNQKLISYETHVEWYKKVLANSNSKILIITKKENSIGVIRLRFLCGDSAEIDIYLDPNMIGKGLGKYALKSAIEWVKVNTPIVALSAKVIAGNHHSMCLFERVGFSVRYYHYELML